LCVGLFSVSLGNNPLSGGKPELVGISQSLNDVWLGFRIHELGIGDAAAHLC